jgi:hypothetical protein
MIQRFHNATLALTWCNIILKSSLSLAINTPIRQYMTHLSLHAHSTPSQHKFVIRVGVHRPHAGRQLQHCRNPRRTDADHGAQHVCIRQSGLLAQQRAISSALRKLCLPSVAIVLLHSHIPNAPGAHAPTLSCNRLCSVMRDLPQRWVWTLQVQLNDVVVHEHGGRQYRLQGRRKLVHQWKLGGWHSSCRRAILWHHLRTRRPGKGFHTPHTTWDPSRKVQMTCAISSAQSGGPTHCCSLSSEEGTHMQIQTRTGVGQGTGCNNCRRFTLQLPPQQVQARSQHGHEAMPSSFARSSMLH